MYKTYAMPEKIDDEFETTFKTSSHRKQKRHLAQDQHQSKRPNQSYQYEYIYETLSDDSDKIKF